MDPTAAAYILRHSPVHPPILLFVLPSICPVVLQSNCTFVFPSICPLVRPSFRSFVRRSFRPFVRPSFRPFVSLSFRPFVYVRPSVHLSVRPYVHLFIRPCVRPSLSFRPFVPPPSVRLSIPLFFRLSVGQTLVPWKWWTESLPFYSASWCYLAWQMLLSFTPPVVSPSNHLNTDIVQLYVFFFDR